ncbi:hypothetical protein BUZ67_01665 [Staphylococcus pasteuri]|uniref:hypothetical protein n=1 Tax=Staphylococcus pasteuri TaxID=45972 RepID=UPI000D3B43EF|nr:hypothetical protein [Staphylococcus pasteuri]PTU83435.1 hypothetical protein BUZ66_02995 [Staphylococcus pasteuri]PTU86631.1 hypothetical protein BUZ67_01665 [Staphylococcus pasteuri]RIO37630.1 hypothetical protein BUZ65_01705 [Staphylococcus pasteuri]
MNKTEEKLLGLLKIAWQNEWRLKSQLAERDEELEHQRRIMQSEINMYKEQKEMYKRAFKILKGECADERNSDLSH